MLGAVKGWQAPKSETTLEVGRVYYRKNTDGSEEWLTCAAIKRVAGKNRYLLISEPMNFERLADGDIALDKLELVDEGLSFSMTE